MTTKAQAIRPPSSLSRAEKLQFRRIAEQLTGGETALNGSQVDAICDLVRTRSRVDMLTKMLDRQDQNSGYGTDRKAILELVSAINATTTLAQRIAARIGLAEGRKA